MGRDTCACYSNRWVTQTTETVSWVCCRWQSGEIAKHLDFVGHGIRTQLDEIKRKEVDRLRQIIRLQMKLQHGMKDDDDDDDDVGADDAGRRGIVCLLASWFLSEIIDIIT